ELRFKNHDLRIIAIEKDEKLIRQLQKIFSGDKNIEFIEGDVLKVLPSLIHKSKFVNHNYKIVGNIPYYITGKLLRTIGELPIKPALCVLTIQKEVAERIVEKPPRMNRLAASVQFWAEPAIKLILKKNLFVPAPEVDSATVIFKGLPREKSSERGYYKIVRAIFAQPRKTLLNNLSSGLEIPKSEAEMLLKKAGIKPDLRPQNLSVEDILKLASAFGTD
ncbi:MAG: 16S rRNA (adenine(1518)-N(6)/adenine(1519)-N(6))-dimethyltransferase, partial [Candidatus Liptonbacteria bacterium]|nr:16S rRNA (adenine(1518)-N(6)/adenine(1519)-N(6))-dimethyltransferase [Candidatus Liptonbacteria bacterium]